MNDNITMGSNVDSNNRIPKPIEMTKEEVEEKLAEIPDGATEHPKEKVSIVTVNPIPDKVIKIIEKARENGIEVEVIEPKKEEGEEQNNLTTAHPMMPVTTPQFIKERYPYALSDEDIESLNKYATELEGKTKLELIQAGAQFDRNSALMELAEGFSDQASALDSNTKAIEYLVNGLETPEEDKEDELADTETPFNKFCQSSLKKRKEALEESKATNEDIHNMLAVLKSNILLGRCAYEIAKENYTASHGDTTIYEDIVEKCMKDKNTLRNGSLVNREKIEKSIDEVLEVIKNKNYIEAAVEKLMPKVQNRKALRTLAKELLAKKQSIYPPLEKIGVTQAQTEQLRAFILIETKYALDGGAHATELMSLQEADVVPVLFFYHLSKIVQKSRNGIRYTTLIYRMMIMHFLEVIEKLPNKTAANPKYRVTDLESREDNEGSKARMEAFDKLMPLLAFYRDAMRDMSLVQYARQRARSPK